MRVAARAHTRVHIRVHIRAHIDPGVPVSPAALRGAISVIRVALQAVSEQLKIEKLCSGQGTENHGMEPAPGNLYIGRLPD